jgi:Holliday junction resolvase RusA-like endonuclease
MTTVSESMNDLTGESLHRANITLFVECSALRVGVHSWVLDPKTPLRHFNKSNYRFDRRSAKARSEWETIQSEEKAVALVAQLAAKREPEIARRLIFAEVNVHLWVFIGDIKIGKVKHTAEVRARRIDCDGVKGIIDGLEAGQIIANDNQIISLSVHQSAVPGQNGDKLAIIVELASENPAPQIEGIEQLLRPACRQTVQVGKRALRATSHRSRQRAQMPNASALVRRSTP